MLGEGLAKDFASLLLNIAPSASWISPYLACCLMKYLNRNENGLKRGRVYSRSDCNTSRSPFSSC